MWGCQPCDAPERLGFAAPRVPADPVPSLCGVEAAVAVGSLLLQHPMAPFALLNLEEKD